MSRFDYIRYDEEAMKLQAQFKATFAQLDQMVSNLPKGRAAGLVLTKLEEAYMWVGKAIRDAQVESQHRDAPLQEERTDDGISEPKSPPAAPVADTSSVPWGVK